MGNGLVVLPRMSLKDSKRPADNGHLSSGISCVLPEKQPGSLRFTFDAPIQILKLAPCSYAT
jgi:hypothetical protein